MTKADTDNGSEPNKKSPARRQFTRLQRHLMSELEDVARTAGTDFWNVNDHARYKSEFLQMAIRQSVNGMIIKRYTMIDELLTVIICDFYFSRWKGERSYNRLWKEKSFRIFNHYLLDETMTVVKMNVVKSISPLPSNIEDIINRINAIRNAIAHSFFPENRRKHMSSKKLTYDGVDVYSAAGARKIEDDFQTVRVALEERTDRFN